MTKVCLDLFAGLGGFSQAFTESDNWKVLTVDKDIRFRADVQTDILDCTHENLPNADVILASPPCTAFSMAASGTHLDSDGNPVSDWGRTSLELVHHIIGVIKATNPDWWVLENPMGGLRRELGAPDAHVWWCQYGSDRAKPTDLWGKIPPSFDAKRCYNGAGDCHHYSAPRESDSGTQASNLSAAERARIPYGLSKAILEAVENPEPEQQTLTEVDP